MSRRSKFDVLMPVAVFCAAFAARLAYVLQSRSADPTFSLPLMDARWHLQWGMAIAQGDVVGREVFFRAPLYPYFLGLLLWLFGPNFTALKILQALLGSATAVLIYGLGGRLGGRRTGAAAGLIAALYGPLVFFDGEFLIPTLFLPLSAGALLLALSALERRGLRRWAAAGFALGMAAIARPNVLVFAPVLVGWMAWEMKSRRWAKPAALWALAFLIPVMAVSLRNKIVGGEFVLIASQGGVNFYMGNNPQADGKTAMAPGPAPSTGTLYRDSVQVSSTMEAERRLGGKPTPGEVSSYWFGRAFSFIVHDPFAWLKLTVKKTYYLANGYEIPSNRRVYRVREWSPLLGFLMTRDPVGLPYGLLFPLALAGMALGAGKPAGRGESRFTLDKPAYRLLVLYTATYGATVVAFFVTARHRLPMLDGMIPLAALGLVGMVALFKGGHGRKKLVVLAVFVAALLVSNTRFMGVREDKTREFHIGMGEVYGRLGRYREALAEFDAAIAEDPYLERAWFNKGAALLEMGRRDEALAAFSETLRLNPDFAPAWSHIGNIRLATGRLDEAEKSYRRAIALDPELAVAHSNLALVLFKKGDKQGYIRELELAVKADPYFAPSNINLAQHYIATGRPEAARPLLLNVLRADPDNRTAIQFLEMTDK